MEAGNNNPTSHYVQTILKSYLRIIYSFLETFVSFMKVNIDVLLITYNFRYKN